MTVTEACPDASPNEPEWTEEQANAGTGRCTTCGRYTLLRVEPFGMTPQCKSDWERIVYDE